MNRYPVAMESGAMLMAIPASARSYAGTEAGDSNADSHNIYTSLMAC